jgi:hypothetical protein
MISKCLEVVGKAGETFFSRSVNGLLVPSASQFVEPPEGLCYTR